MADPRTQQDVLMPLAQVKRMLGMAESGPLGCAFGLTKDKKECLLLVEKTGSGKKIGSKLKADGKDLTLDVGTVRFGTVNFDLENDPGTVRFTVNRAEAGGTIITLTRLAKKAGYQGIVINVDPSLEEETGAADGETAPMDPQALKLRLTALVQKMIARIGIESTLKDKLTNIAKQAQLLLSTNELKGATEQCDALEALLNTPPTKADTSALATRLADLAKRMPARVAADPASESALATLASGAQTKLDAGDLAGATAAADAVEALLNGPFGTDATKAPKPPVSFVKMQTSRLIWNQARKKVASEIKQYTKAVQDEFEGDEDEEEIIEALEGLDDILLALDDRLTDVLDDMLDERTPPAEHAKLLAEAKSLLAEYETYLASNPLISRLEGPTPFGVTLTVGSTLGKTLQGLRAALH